MKVMKTLLLVGAVITSFAPKAEVELEFHRDISPILVDGDEIGYSLFSQKNYTIPNGVNQVVLRVSKLVERQGEREKYNSDAFVFTFKESDKQLFIEPGTKIVRTEQADKFNESPQFIVKDANGRKVDFDYAVLPASDGLTRDYERELAKFNDKNYPDLNVVTATAITTAQNTTSPKLAVSNSKASQQENMFGYWLEQATPDEINRFTELAFAARSKTEVSVPNDSSQPIQMLGYWYNKASDGERKKLLAHLVSL
ncbi:DUF2057 family protein [Vibrio tubiashii]|uniref:YccT family protein n=1 Tax=Vibrio tubiashii TaxID=29498 RepID=UPI00349ECC4D